jgi:succinate dehydrogenase / fumarate reductase membrane anchor subunit
MAVATALAAAALLLHAWVGVRDVILDYVKPLPLRAGLLVLVALVLAAEGLWAARLLLGGAA